MYSCVPNGREVGAVGGRAGKSSKLVGGLE